MTDQTQTPNRLTREQTQAIRARQKSRNKVLGMILFAAAALFFAITIVKTGVW